VWLAIVTVMVLFLRAVEPILLLAVPLTAVIGVLVKFAVGRYLESGLYLDQ
jgi:hypothetical protein